MKKIIFIIITTLLINFQILNSNNLELYNINTDNFPEITADLIYIKNFKSVEINNIDFKENGIEITPKLTCPDASNPEPVSVILTIDVSASMGSIIDFANNYSRLKIAKDAAKLWVDNMDYSNNSECAITSFSTQSYLNQNFSKNTDQLNNVINEMQPLRSTSFNEGILGLPGGGATVAKNAKHKNVIIFLTDGISEIDYNTALNALNENNSIFYPIGFENNLTPELKDLAKATGGIFYEKVNSAETLLSIYEKLLFITSGAKPCKLEWESQSCLIDNIIDITVNDETNQIYNYTIGANKLLKIKYKNTNYIKFGIVTTGTSATEEITIEAINDDIYIENIINNNNNFTIEWTSNQPPFTLKVGETASFDLTYNANDELYTAVAFQFNTDACSGKKFYASAGDQDLGNKDIEIKLEFPNGGEKFLALSDTIINYSGVAPDDNVLIEFSSDDGYSWSDLSKDVNNHKYDWSKLPDINSDSCLIRASLPKKDGESWTSLLKSNNTVDVKFVEIDKFDDIIIVGSYTDVMEFENGTEMLNTQMEEKYFLAKFNNRKKLLWSKQIKGSQLLVTDLEIDHNNDAVICGSFNGVIEYDETVIGKKGEKTEGFLLKFNSTDGKIAGNGDFFVSCGGSDNNTLTNLAIDSRNNIFLTGLTTGDFKFKNSVISNTSLNRYFIFKVNDTFDYQVGKIAKAGGKGLFEHKVSIDQEDNVYSSCRYENEFQFNSISLVAFGNNDNAIIKFDNDLNILNYNYLQSDGQTRVNEIKFDKDNNPYIAGYITQTLKTRYKDDYFFKEDPTKVKPIILKLDQNMKYSSITWFNSNNQNSNEIYDMEIYNDRIYVVGRNKYLIQYEDEDSKLNSYGFEQAFEFDCDLNFDNYNLKKIDESNIFNDRETYVNSFDIQNDILVYGGRFTKEIFDGELKLNAPTDSYPNGFLYRKVPDDIGKYDKELKWFKPISTENNELTHAFEIDDEGNIYIVTSIDNDILIDGIVYKHTNTGSRTSLFMKLDNEGNVIKVVPMNAHFPLNTRYKSELTVREEFVGLAGFLDKPTDFGNGITLEPDEFGDIFLCRFDKDLNCLESHLISYDSENSENLKIHATFTRNLDSGIENISIVLTTPANSAIKFESGGALLQNNVKTLYQATYQNGDLSKVRDFTDGFEKYYSLTQHYDKTDGEVYRYELMKINADMKIDGGKVVQIKNGEYVVIKSKLFGNQEIFFQGKYIIISNYHELVDYDDRLFLMTQTNPFGEYLIEELDNSGDKQPLFELIITEQKNDYDNGELKFYYSKGKFYVAGLHCNSFIIEDLQTNKKRSVINSYKTEILIFDKNTLDTLNIKDKQGNNDYSTNYLKAQNDKIYMSANLANSEINSWGINHSSIDKKSDQIYSVVDYKLNRIEDTSDSLFSIIKLQPEDFNIGDNIDMGVIPINTSTDKLILDYFENNSNFEIEINEIKFDNDNDKFSLLSPQLPIIVLPNSTQSMEFQFKSDISGNFNSDFIININYFEFTSNIKGEALAYDIDLPSKLIDFGDVFIDDSNILIDELILTNLSNFAIKIDSIIVYGANKDVFEIINVNTDTPLNTGDIQRADLSFSPNQLGEVYSKLAIFYDNLKIPLLIDMKGNGIEGNFDLTIETQIFDASTKSKINIPIKLNIEEKALKNVSKITSKLKFNKTLIVPSRKGPQGELVGNNREIDLEFYRIDGDFILEQSNDYKVTLGNANSTVLDIYDTKIYDLNNEIKNNYLITEIDGSLSINNICEIGGERLVFNTKDAFLSISPNPASINLNIIYNVIEASPYNISIIDLEGNTVFNKDYTNNQTGLFTEILDLNSWNAGTYIIKLETETLLFTDKIKVIK